MKSLTMPTASPIKGNATAHRMSVAPGVNKSTDVAPPTSGDKISLTGDTHVESKAPARKGKFLAAAAATGLTLVGVGLTAQPAAAHSIQCGMQYGSGTNNWGQQINYSVNTCNGSVNWQNQWTGEYGSYYDGQYDARNHHHGHGHHHGHVHGHGHHHGHGHDAEDAAIGLLLGIGIGAIIFGN